MRIVREPRIHLDERETKLLRDLIETGNLKTQNEPWKAVELYVESLLLKAYKKGEEDARGYAILHEEP